MTEYEYVTVGINGEIGEALNQISKDRWEPVCFIGQQTTPSETEGGEPVVHMVFVMKREKSALITLTKEQAAEAARQILSGPKLVKD